MPSHLKFRIKHPTETTHCNLNDYPPDLKKSLEDNKVISPNDYNITNSTCAFLMKFGFEGTVPTDKVFYGDSAGSQAKSIYLCGIRFSTKNVLLKPSETNNPIVEEDKYFVSGAKKVEDSDELTNIKNYSYYKDIFICKYIDKWTAKSEIGPNNLVKACMCNCYCPRGGLGAGFNTQNYDGALKDIGAFNMDSNNVLYDQLKDGDARLVRRAYSGPILKNLPKDKKLLNEPRTLSYLYMMLNARASVMSCCYWNNSQVLIYQPNWFRTIDLAYAKLNARVNDKITKQMVGTDLIENYTYITSDYYPQTDEDYEVKNRLLNRNYDFTLPNTPTGNNARILISLKEEITGGLVKNDNKSEHCAKYNNWHYHNEGFFCPENCAHPNYEVRYKWGCVCNGGGAFSLDDQIACPYYHSPIAGDKDAELNSALTKLYPGDYVSAAAILELMWLSKGGFPWTQKEWEARWKIPYIWVTLPYSPIDINEWGQRKPTTQSIYTEDGIPKDVFYYNDANQRYKQAMYVPRIISKKVSVDYQTGVIKRSAAYALPGGSLTAFKVSNDGAVVDDAKKPDFPTFINSLVLDSLSSVSIYFPRTDFTIGLVTPDDIEGMKAYVNLRQKAHNVPYNKLIWSENGAYTLVLGTARGRFEKVYCLNTAFLLGDWLTTSKLDLILTGSTSYLTRENQDVIRKLFDDLIKNDLNTDRMCLGRTDAFKVYEMSDTDSTFIFRDVPLNLLVDKNIILILAQDQYAKWIVDWVYVRPQFRHAWTYQKETTLLSDWKNWNGRPRYVTNNDKVQVGKATDNDKKYLKIPEKSGITKWQYFDISVPNLTDYADDSPEAKAKQSTNSPYSYGDLEPYMTYQPIYANQATIYDSREDSSLQSTLGAKLGGIGVTVASGNENGAILPSDLESYLQNVKPGNGGEVGNTTWYSLSACSPYVVIVADPTIFSIQNEPMVFSMTASIKDEKGNVTSNVPLIPVAYTQVNRKLPAYAEKKSNSDTSWKTPSNLYFWDYGICDDPEINAPVKTIKSNGDVQIDNPLINLLIEETDTHNWIIIAKAISLDTSEVPTWLDYLIDKPSKVVNADSVILMRSNTDLYMQYAYIKNKKYTDYGASVEWDDDSCETAITPNARGNIYRTLFKYKPWNNDFKVDSLEEVICGAKTSHALWPYHRIGCRDVEINYSWANYVYTYQCLPYHLYCVGPRTIYGPIQPFVGNQISGDPRNANLVGKYLVMYNSCCGDHDFSQSCHSFHGSLYYPYTTGCDVIPMYDVISDCLWDFSYALPYELIQEIKAGKELAHGLERLRGPRQYTPTCTRDPIVETGFAISYPCVAQNIYLNTMRSVKPNAFNGFVRTRGPVYQDEMKSMSPAGNVGMMPGFGNVGREINVVSLDYMVEKVFTANETSKYRYELFESPPTEGKRSVPVLTHKAINPYFYYVMSDPVFGETFNPDSTTSFTTKADKLLKEGYEKTIAYNNPDLFIDDVVHWAWPENERDKLRRGVNHAIKYEGNTTSKPGLQINSIMDVSIPPYITNNYNGDISLGPTISKDDTKTYCHYLLYAKSEYYDPKTNTYHKPIIGSKELGVSPNISQLDEKSIDIDLKYEVLDTGELDNSEIEGSQHLNNTLSNAANFITSKEQSYVYTSDTVPILTINGSELATKKPTVTKKTNRNYLIEYELTNINLGKDILRSINLTFNSKVLMWSSNDTGTVALKVTTKSHSGGDEITKNVGFVTNAEGISVLLNYKDIFTEGKADIKLSFDVKEWYGIYSRTDTASFSYSPETPSSGYATNTTQSFYDSQAPTIESSFWTKGDMEDAISEIKIYAYKKEGFYPGLNIRNVNSNHLAKYPVSTPVSSNKLNTSFKIQQGYKLISLESTNAELNIHGSVYKVDYELKSDFIKNEKMSMIVDFTGATVKDLVTTSVVNISSDSTELVTKTVKIDFPLDTTSLSYILDFDMIVDINYKTKINCIIESATQGFSPTTDILKTNDKIIKFKDLNKLKLSDVVTSMKFTILKPGEEGEVIRVDKTGFWYSLGNKCKRGNNEFNFYSESKNEDYQIKWATSMIGNSSYGSNINMPIMIDSSTDVSTGLLVEGLSPGTEIGSIYPKEFAPPYPKGELILKGNSYIFDVQYKDGWDVTKEKAENNEYTFNVIGGDAKDVTGKYELYQKELWEKANKLREETQTQFLIEALIPMQDWYPIWVLTGGKYIEERSIDLDQIAFRTNKRKPLYYDQLKEYRETNCEFNWYRWKWEEVLDWSFNSEERRRYGPKPDGAVGEYAGGKPEWSPPGHAIGYTPSSPITINYFGVSETIEWTVLYFSLHKTMSAWNDLFQVPWAYDQMSQEFKEAMEGYGDLSEANALNARYQEYLNKEYFWMFRNRDYIIRGHGSPNNYYNVWMSRTSMEMTGVPFMSFARLDEVLF